MRRVEDILKDMESLGLSPETIEDDILKMQRDVLEHVVSIDENLSDDQVRGAFKFVFDCHARRPIDQPVSISLNGSGGVVLNRGNINTMNSSQIAEKHTKRMQANEPSALQLNRLLMKQNADAG